VKRPRYEGNCKGKSEGGRVAEDANGTWGAGYEKPQEKEGMEIGETTRTKVLRHGGNSLNLVKNRSVRGRPLRAFGLQSYGEKNLKVKSRGEAPLIY